LRAAYRGLGTGIDHDIRARRVVVNSDSRKSCVARVVLMVFSVSRAVGVRTSNKRNLMSRASLRTLQRAVAAPAISRSTSSHRRKCPQRHQNGSSDIRFSPQESRRTTLAQTARGKRCPQMSTTSNELAHDNFTTCSAVSPPGPTSEKLTNERETVDGCTESR
jgi:hypothetical protein